MSTLRLQRFVRTSLWLLPLGCVAWPAAPRRRNARRRPGDGLPARPAEPDRDAVSDAQTILSVLRHRAGVADHASS